MNSDALAHNNKIYTDPKDTMVRLHVNHAYNVKARHHTTNIHHQRSARASTRTASKKGDARNVSGLGKALRDVNKVDVRRTIRR